jgi:hypothetical protein
MIASPTISTSFSSISSSSILVTSGRSVSFETNRAVSSAPSWNFGSIILWIRAEEYSATSVRSFRSASVNSPFVPAENSLLSVWMAPSAIVVLSGTVSIDLTSKPVVFAIVTIMGAWLSVFLKKTGWPGLDDLADDARADRDLQLEELGLHLLEFGLLLRVVAPKGRGVVDLLEGDVVALDQVQGHRLRLEGLDDLRGRELDDRRDVLSARSGLRNYLYQQGAPEGAR